jgi:FkbM family methyltransferase
VVHETLSGCRNPGVVQLSDAGFSDRKKEPHIHHIKLFTKAAKEIDDRNRLYTALSDVALADTAARSPDETPAPKSAGDTTEMPVTESVYAASQVRVVRSIPLEAFDLPGQRAFWCEWAHPHESPRTLDSLINNSNLAHWGDYIRPGSTAIDIGAHSGDTAVPMLLLASDFRRNIRGKVFALEPNPDVYQVLELTAELNRHLGTIVPVRAAISDKPGEVEIFDHGNANCNGGILAADFSPSLGEKLKSIAGHSFKAPGLDLGSFVDQYFTANDLRNLTFIKIDCEGFDKEILRAGKNFIIARKPIIQVEWFDWFGPEDSADLFNVISELGYIPHHPHSGAVVTPSEKTSDLATSA